MAASSSSRESASVPGAPSVTGDHTEKSRDAVTRIPDKMDPHLNLDPGQPSLDDLMDADLTPEELRQRVIGQVTASERDFYRQFPRLWLSTLLAPLVVTAALLLIIGTVSGWAMVYKLVGAALITFFVLGRFVILAGVEGDQTGWLAELPTPGQLYVVVTYMDFVVALFVTFHMGILFRIPWLGPKIAGLTSDSKFIMEQQPWIRRLAFGALVGFVMFPTSTTGSIGGSIFGRLLGLGRLRTLLGVFVGSALGNGVMYFFAREINELNNGPFGLFLKIAGIALMVIGFMAIEMRYRKAKQRYLEEHGMATRQNDSTNG